MSEPLELVEHETKTVRLTQQQARRLQAAAGGALNVRLAHEPGHHEVTATSMVGTLVLEDMRVLVRPKIRPENLFLLLEVGLSADAWRQESYEYETTADLLPSIIAFYARTLETTLARGVLRSYRAEEDRLVALRGRLDLTAQFRQAGVRVPVACRFDEHTADIDENRYLKGATRLAVRAPGVNAGDRRRLLRQLVALEDVADVPVSGDLLDRIPISRLNAHYEPALRLARLLLDNLTLVDQSGDRAASSFMVNMNDLFEDFVTQRLQRELRGRLDVQGQYSTHLAEHRRVSIRPDLVFRRRGDNRYVADIKYKLTGDARARSNDYYQLLAYTTALDLPEGVLIHCLADGGVPERSVTVRHAGKVLHTLAVDLTGPPSSVAEAITELANWIERRSTPAAQTPLASVS